MAVAIIWAILRALILGFTLQHRASRRLELEDDALAR